MPTEMTIASETIEDEPKTMIASETTEDEPTTFHVNSLATQVSNVNRFGARNPFARSHFNNNTSCSKKKETLHCCLTLTEDKTKAQQWKPTLRF